MPGAKIDVADVASERNSATKHALVVVGGSGSFTVTISPAGGTNVLVVTSTAPDGGTAQTVRTVVNDVVDGTLIFDASDPSGDENGPGNYAYPTSSNFHPGAYDLTDFQVYDTGTTVTFRVQTADLSPTFGSPVGAQMVDVYVRQPGGSPTSTAASFPQRNYVIDAGSAWTRLIEVQGFGQRFIDASEAAEGNIPSNSVGEAVIADRHGQVEGFRLYLNRGGRHWR